MKSDRLVKELDRILDMAYADQMNSFSHFVDLVDLLKYAMCEHEWTPVLLSPDDFRLRDGVTHWPTCFKCNLEKLED